MNRLIVLAEIVVLGFAPRLLAQDAVGKQSDMSLDSLLNIEVSSASKHWEKMGDAPASTTVITADDIRSFGYCTLSDVLASVRGFYVTYDRNYTYVGTRGFSRPTDYNDRILLLVNGHTMNEGFDGSAPFGTEFALDMSAIEQIEIVRGPGSVLYGSGAMFAIVNIVTVKGTDVDHLFVGGEVGTAGKRGVSLLVGGEPFASWDALLSARWGRVEGRDLYFREYDSSNGGIAQNLDWDEYYGVFASLKHSQMTLQGLVTSRRKGIPTAAYEITFNEQHAQTTDRYIFLEARYDKDIAEANGVTARVYFDHYFYGGSYPYDVASFDANKVSRIGGEVQYDWAISSSNQLTGGMEMAWNYRAEYDNRTDEEIFFSGNFPYHTWSVYLQDEQQFAEQFSLLAGVRSDAREDFGSSLSPRAALVYHPSSRSSVKLMFGNAFRFPNLYESEYYDDLSNFRISRDLARERITTYEAEGSLQMTDQLSGLATVYTYAMRNLIDQVSNPVDSSLQFQNVQKVQALGCEAELTARWKNGINTYVSYVYENVRDKALSERLTNSPLHFVKCGCQIPLAGIVRASFEVRYESARMTVMGTSTRPFWLTNVSFVTLRSGGNRTNGSGCGSWNASLLIKNLFNTPYEYPGGFEHLPIAAIAQDGREYTLRVEWEF